MTATSSNFTTLEMCAIAPSSTNPRRSMDPVALDGLCESIKSVGLQNPIIVRPDADGYEIVAGHRRYAAFEKLGREEIPAIVREMTDEECREAQLIDNLQRADLDLLEECGAYLALRERLGTAAAIAQRVGKTAAHVTRVLQLDNLSLYTRHALGARLIGFDHALLLAKLGFEEQEKALRFVLNPYGEFRKQPIEAVIEDRLQARADDPVEMRNWEAVSVGRLRDWIETHIELELKSAPWPLDDAGIVPAAGACTACPKNTAANEALFGDLAIEEASCTDAQCYQDKREAFVEIQLAAVPRIGGTEPVRLSWADSDKKPKWLKDGSGPKLDQIFQHGQWVESEAGCDHTVHGVAIDFDRSFRRDEAKKPGVVLRVCVAAGCKRHPKAWERAVPKLAAQRGDAEAEKQKREASIAACRAENVTRLELAKQAIQRTKKIPGEVLRAMMLEAAGWQFEESSPQWMEILKKSDPDSADFAQATVAVYLHNNGLEVYEGGYGSPDRERKEFLAALKTLGVDGSSAWQKPSPKSKPGRKEVAEKKSQSGRKGASTKTKTRPAPKKAPVKQLAATAAKKKPPRKGGRK